jgi:hypothetical protein
MAYHKSHFHKPNLDGLSLKGVGPRTRKLDLEALKIDVSSLRLHRPRVFEYRPRSSCKLPVASCQQYKEPS